MREEIKPDVQAFVKAHGRPPGLGIVLVGDDPASHVYVRNKLKAAEDVGFYADCTRLAAGSTLDDVLREVDRLNQSEQHDGANVFIAEAPIDHGSEALDLRPGDSRDVRRSGWRRDTGRATAATLRGRGVPPVRLLDR